MNSLQSNRMEVVMQGWAVPLPRCGPGAAVPRGVWAAGVRPSKDPGVRLCGLVGSHTLLSSST